VRLAEARKVLDDPSGYTHAKRIDASRALYKSAIARGDADLALRALKLKPTESFEKDGEPALRLQRLLLLKESGELTLEDGPVVVPPVQGGPVMRSDGQIHNFEAKPYPGTRRGLTLKEYQVRTNNRHRGK
jgi:hypothetical protein